MDTLQLTDSLIKILVRFPETGMGYQLVNIILKNGKILTSRKIINGELLILDDGEKLLNEEIDEVMIVARKDYT